jgi:hypothetical protein
MQVEMKLGRSSRWLPPGRSGARRTNGSGWAARTSLGMLGGLARAASKGGAATAMQAAPYAHCA